MSGATAAAVFLATTGVSILTLVTALITTCCTILSKIRYRHPPVLSAESEERT